MDFARRQLEKYGWSDGKGLGKHEDGISEALKPKLKRSVAGIGYDAASEFNEHWWKTLYDKAATNIRVEEKNGKTKKIKTIDQDEFQITNNMWHLTKKKGKSEQRKEEKYQDYFVKKAILTNKGVEMKGAEDADRTVEVKDGKTKNVTAIDNEKHQDHIVENKNEEDRLNRAEDADKRERKAASMEGNIYNMTDEQLFAACKGRTAHKGARHGLKALGKLARIEEQERMLLASPKYEAYSHSKRNKTPRENSMEIHEDTVETTDLCNDSEEKIVKIKKKRRHCNTKVNQDLEAEGLAESSDSLAVDNMEPIRHGNKTPREKCIEIHEDIIETTDLCDNSEETIVKKKRKKKHCNTKVNQGLGTEIISLDNMASNEHDVKVDDSVKRKKIKKKN